jgi:hypothetical protein
MISLFKSSKKWGLLGYIYLLTVTIRQYHWDPDGIILSVGGQLPNNIAMQLHRQQVGGTWQDNVSGEAANTNV